MTKSDPFRCFETSREIICLAVMLYVRFPLSLRNVEDLLRERGIDVSHESVRYDGIASVPCSPLRYAKHFSPHRLYLSALLYRRKRREMGPEWQRMHDREADVLLSASPLGHSPAACGTHCA